MLVSTVDLFCRARERPGLAGREALRLDWRELVSRKDHMRDDWGAGAAERYTRLGVEVVRGRAEFVAPHRVQAGDRVLEAGKVVVATGSAPAVPPIPGREHALTSDGLLELFERPGRLVVVGGGVIALEFAFCFARAGTDVTVLEAMPHVLGGVDGELRDALVELARSLGMRVFTGARLKAILPDRTVEAEVGGELRQFPATHVLLATGRPPNVRGLGLEKAGVAFNDHGIQVDDHLRSVSAPHVYAAGDASGRFQLSPVAWYQGALAARNAVLGDVETEDYAALPTTVFTIPPLAQVGLTEEAARAQGLDVAISRSAYDDNPAAGIQLETAGFAKLVYDAGSDKLLGVHVLGPDAEETILAAAVALRAGMTRRDLARQHYVFPSLAGTLVEAAIDYQALDSMLPDRQDPW